MTSCQAPKQKADLILTNGIVYTVDSVFSIDQAFAVADGRFIAIGTTEEILKNYEAVQTIDAEAKPFILDLLMVIVTFSVLAKIWLGMQNLLEVSRLTKSFNA